ncbi:MAG: cupredoxin domain-containing protein [Solirubrobacteraceae bacterium]
MRATVMGLCKRHLLAAVMLGPAALGLVALMFPAIASSVAPSISAYNEPGIYGGHYWSPSTAMVSSGGKLEFVNSYTTTYHGLKFTGGTAGESPSCPGIAAVEGPSGAFNWKIECTFSKPGTYTFICTVHPTEMKGTITVPGTPKAKTTLASGAKQTEATLNGSVEPEGNAVEYRFEYGTASVSEHETAATSLGLSDFASHSVSVPVAGLLPEKTYRFQLIATYGAGKTPVLGGEQTVVTPAPAAPTATTTAATVKGQHEATLNGKVDPNGGNATEYFFEYATAAEYAAGHTYGKKTPPVTGFPADNAEHPASTSVGELESGTTYHFRLVATNAAATEPVKGEDRTFTTESPSPPTKEEPTPTPTNPLPGPTPSPGPGPTSPEPEVPRLASPLVGGSLKLLPLAHRGGLRVSLAVSQGGAPARIEVDLLAKVGHNHTQALVGRLVRGSLAAGKAAFSVTLNARGKGLLHRHHKLRVTVKITLTPPMAGGAVKVARSVVLRA